jgi:spore coat protein U-like protein
MKRILIPAMAAGSFLTAGAAEAATKQTNMSVNMVITADCTVSATALDFGTLQAIDMSGTHDDVTPGVVTVTCTNGHPYTISLGAGNGGSATVAARKMTGGPGGTATIDYTLYTTSGRSAVWGDGTLSTLTVGDTGTGNAQTFDVFGQVPQQDDVGVGTYSDSVTVTVTY